MVTKPATFMPVANDFDNKLTQLNKRLANVGEKLRCLATCEAADAQKQVLGSHVAMFEPIRGWPRSNHKRLMLALRYPPLRSQHPCTTLLRLRRARLLAGGLAVGYRLSAVSCST